MVRAAALLLVIAACAACGGRDPTTQHVSAILTSAPPDVPPGRGGPLRPASLAPVIAIAAGEYHACALHADHTVSCWGNNAQGEVVDHATAHLARGGAAIVSAVATPAASSIADVLEIAAGRGRTCARRADGVWCWGSPVGEPIQVATVTDAVEITTSCARTAAGEVWCWNDALAAGREPRLEPAVDLDAIDERTCALTTAGAVRCQSEDARYERTVAGAVELALSHRDACVRLATGRVRCWRTDQYYDGKPEDDLRPHPVDGLDQVESIAAGGYYMCARSRDRRVRCWGLAPGADNLIYRPRLIAGLIADDLASGDEFACARDGGAVACWGDNNYGQLGTGWGRLHAEPVVVPGIDDAVDVMVGNRSSCARRRTGAVTCWGRLGDAATQRDLAFARDAVALAGADQLCAILPGGRGVCAEGGLDRVRLDDVVDIAQSMSHTVAVTTTGGLIGFGQDNFAELGRGEIGDYRPRPVRSSVVTDATAVAVGGHTTCIVRRDATVACVGLRADRTSMVRPETIVGVDHATDVAVGFASACALIADGTVRCWGDGTQGLLGRPSPLGPAPTAVAVAGLTDAVQLVGASEAMCARRRDGTIACWGTNATGVIAAPWTMEWTEHPVDAAVTGATDLALSDDHACAVVGTGQVACWGEASLGQLGDVVPRDLKTPARVAFPTAALVR